MVGGHEAKLEAHSLRCRGVVSLRSPFLRRFSGDVCVNVSESAGTPARMKRSPPAPVPCSQQIVNHVVWVCQGVRASFPPLMLTSPVSLAFSIPAKH